MMRINMVVKCFHTSKILHFLGIKSEFYQSWLWLLLSVISSNISWLWEIKFYFWQFFMFQARPYLSKEFLVPFQEFLLDGVMKIHINLKGTVRSDWCDSCPNHMNRPYLDGILVLFRTLELGAWKFNPNSSDCIASIVIGNFTTV